MHHKSTVKLYKWAVIHNASWKILICFIMIHSTYNSISLIIQTIWQKLLDSAITWIINIHSSCQSPMSYISIWSYQVLNRIHDVPGQTSQNSEGLKSNWYQQWKEPSSWNARNVQVVQTRETCTRCSISWVSFSRTFSCSRIAVIHVMAHLDGNTSFGSACLLICAQLFCNNIVQLRISTSTEQ